MNLSSPIMRERICEWYYKLECSTQYIADLLHTTPDVIQAIIDANPPTRPPQDEWTPLFLEPHLHDCE